MLLLLRGSRALPMLRCHLLILPFVSLFVCFHIAPSLPKSWYPWWSPSWQSSFCLQFYFAYLAWLCSTRFLAIPFQSLQIYWNLGCSYVQGALLPRKYSPIRQEVLSPLSPSPSPSSTTIFFLLIKGKKSKWKDQLQLKKKKIEKMFKQQNFLPRDDQYNISLAGKWKGLEFELVLTRKGWMPIWHKSHTNLCIAVRRLKTSDDQNCEFHLNRGVGWFVTQSTQLFFNNFLAITCYN